MDKNREVFTISRYNEIGYLLFTVDGDQGDFYDYSIYLSENNYMIAHQQEAEPTEFINEGSELTDQDVARIRQALEDIDILEWPYYIFDERPEEETHPLLVYSFQEDIDAEYFTNGPTSSQGMEDMSRLHSLIEEITGHPLGSRDYLDRYR